MKKMVNILAVLSTLLAMNTVSSQTNGVIWITTFSPGSASLEDCGIDAAALATLDSLMQDATIEATFLGAADSVKWRFHGASVHPHVSEAWNDAKRLSRARALRARYGRGRVGVTHEDIAGVKVVWSKASEADFTMEVDNLKEQNAQLGREIADLRNHVAAQGHNGTNGHSGTNGHAKEDPSRFNWRLQAGVWTWQAGSSGNLLSPSIALNIIIDRTAFIIQGGVTPWHKSTKAGDQSNSFVYAGVKYMKTDMLGFTFGAFRGWEFFTSTDNWSFKTTGLSAGVVLAYGKFEFNPTLNVSNINTLEDETNWKLGSSIGVNFNFN